MQPMFPQDEIDAARHISRLQTEPLEAVYPAPEDCKWPVMWARVRMEEDAQKMALGILDMVENEGE